MKIIIDGEKCSGHARCADAAPELFDLDDDGYVIPFEGEVPAGMEDRARAGARACPERAITVE